MAVTRNNSNSPLPYFGPLSGISAYANRGGEIFHYVSNGTNPNDVLNATYRVHVFDTVGEQTITFDRPGSVDVVVIAGGGAGGNGYERYQHGGGGGAGGLIQTYGVAVDIGYTDISVGGGGIGKWNHSGEQIKASGRDSAFGALLAIGGGRGASRGDIYNTSHSGGSGGGTTDTAARNPGSGTVGQGHSGGSAASDFNTAAGGGGAGEPGSSITVNTDPGHGGDGLAIAFYSNNAIYYSGGGAGSKRDNNGETPVGGLGGGANGIITGGNQHGINADYYGGGGSGGVSGSSTTWTQGGSGYQGLVMVRYRIG